MRKQNLRFRNVAPVTYGDHALRIRLVHRPHIDELSHLLNSLLQLGAPPAWQFSGHVGMRRDANTDLAPCGVCDIVAYLRLSPNAPNAFS